MISIHVLLRVEGCWVADYIRVLNLIIRVIVEGVYKLVMMS
jgi:hypothetical protein